MKLVSIFIPAWNAEDYIKETVDSALSQTYENLEVIVVDDGSTDNTKNILSLYVNSGKINYIYEKNQGLAAARNTGIRSAKGKYVAFLDSDDIFLPRKIEKQVQALDDHPDFDISYSDLMHFTEEPKQFFHHRYEYPSGNIFGELLKKQFINPLTVVLRKSVFDKFGLFDENLKRSEDWELWLRLAHAGVKFYHINEVLAHYRIRSAGNLSSVQSEPEMKEKNLEIFLKLRNQLSSEETEKYDFKKVIRRLKNKLVFAYLMVGEKEKAIEKCPSSLMRFIIKIIPSALLKSSFLLIRKLKHRSLLEKI